MTYKKIIGVLFGAAIIAGGSAFLVIPAFSSVGAGEPAEHNYDVDGTLLPPGVKYRAFVHYPYLGKHKPVLFSSCTKTTYPESSNWEAAGWHLNNPKTYRLNEASVPKDVSVSNAYTAINTAWAGWKEADQNIVITQGQSTSVSRPKFNKTNLVAWGNVSYRTAIAVTYTWYNGITGEALESDTIFNRRFTWSYTPYTTDCGGVPGAYDIGNIAIHEFGHWVGLDDLYGDADKDLTMFGYGFTTELKKDTLGPGDASGAAVITP